MTESPWRTDFENAPTGTPVLVYQPAVRYRNGAFFEKYVTEAVYHGVAVHPLPGDQWYSETYNVVLTPTHWRYKPYPPDDLVVESPHDGPGRPGWCDWSSSSEAGDIEEIRTPHEAKDAT